MSECTQTCGSEAPATGEQGGRHHHRLYQLFAGLCRLLLTHACAGWPQVLHQFLASVCCSVQRLISQALVVEQGIGGRLGDYEEATPLEELVVNGWVAWEGRDELLPQLCAHVCIRHAATMPARCWVATSRLLHSSAPTG
jgi:hypothetical protein